MARRVVIAAGRDLLAVLRRRLAGTGLQVAAEAHDAHGVVAAVARERPDLVVLDADLPGGALVAAAAIAAPRATPPVLVVDDDGTEEKLRAAELAGASGYVASADADRLADAVERLLDA